MEAIKNKYDFVMLFDVENGNPNGDPDAGNMPRIDPETSKGIVTDVCIKSKIRNFVNMCMEGKKGYNILIKPDKALNTKFTEAYEECGLETGKKKKNGEDIITARNYMCRNYFDVRAFGAVMSTGDNTCGTVRGPVQITFGKSIDPVFAEEITITRQAKTTVDRQEDGNTEMGNKHIIPYGLYYAEGYISALLAQKVTGFNDDDLEILWQSIENMFEHDRSAARGKMCLRKLFIFKHSSPLGNYPSYKLTEKISIKKKDGVVYPRAFTDYEINVDGNMPEGVELIERV